MMKKLAYAGITGMIISTAFVAASPAQGAARDGICQTGEFCLYFNSNHQGSVSDFTTSIADYGASQPECYEFKGAGAGQGQCVKNNAASVWNRTPGPVTVYYNSGYSGKRQGIATGGKVNLNADDALGPVLKNENASHLFATNSTGNENISYGLYNLSGGSITCGFDGYVTTEGRHEGIDIARSIGSPVRALLDGQVINIARGATGRPGLSTIAIYNATYNKTIIYLHSAPLSGLSVGQNVVHDTQIGTESWRGVSSSGGAHTHVEMRLGRRTNAAVSVGDSTLDNPNPTSFWTTRGYNMR